ncbi:MAG: hypothetical protein AB3X36_02275 [Leptothrix ochracea]|uniref:hypothetical protein n=1 Tax=Leptothrix ochracea TaxID=735331 RepID=UPI0034E1DA9F
MGRVAVRCLLAGIDRLGGRCCGPEASETQGQHGGSQTTDGRDGTFWLSHRSFFAGLGSTDDG